MLLLLVMGSAGLRAQTYYVFLYKGTNNVYNFLYNNNGTIGNTTTFNENTCLFTLNGSYLTNTASSTTSNKLERNGNSLRMGGGSAWTIDSYHRLKTDNTYYLNYNSGWTMTSTTSPGTGAKYTVAYNYTSHPAELTLSAISGEQSISTTGTYNYSANASSVPEYSLLEGYNGTNYYYYSSTMNTAAPTAVTAGVTKTWSVSGAGASYVSINASTGVLTVNSMPSAQTSVTITCTASKSGYTNEVMTLDVYLSPSGTTTESGMYVITNGTYYLGGAAGASINNTLAFTPASCLWTVNNNIWRNSAGGYLYNVNPPSIGTGSDHEWTLGGSESGTTGYSLSRYATDGTTYYLRYNNNAWSSTTSRGSRGRIVFAVTKNTYGSSSTAPTINNGDAQITSTGTNNSFTKTNAAYTRGYIDYVFRSNASHLFELDNSTSINAVPTADVFGYTWSLEGISSDYATINSSTGVINYTSYVPSDVTATVKLTATSQRDASITFVATRPVTFKATMVNPTSITITCANPLSVTTSNPGQITYSLSPSPCYDNVTFSSADNSIAVVDANGVVTGVNAGTTTITVTAKKINGTTAATATVTVNVTEAQMYVIYYDTVKNSTAHQDHYLGGSGINALSDFSPATCLWTATADGKWLNSAGYYLSTNSSLGLTTSSADAQVCTLAETEHGKIGQRLYNSDGSKFLRLSVSGNDWQWNTSYMPYNVVFAVTKNFYPAQSTAPTISGDMVIAQTGSNSSFTRTDAVDHVAYIDYVFHNGDHHCFLTDNATPLTNPDLPFTYVWSLEGIGSSYATINSSTGVITYSNYVSSDVDATVKLTATSANHTYVVTQSVTFKPAVSPARIVVTSDNPMTVYVGHTAPVTYALEPFYAYDHVTYQSASTGTATVAADGTVTGVAVGQTTITLNAARSGGSGVAASATVTVNVRDKVAEPVIAFTPNGASATATITCATPGSTIKYTVNGGAEQTYSGPFTVNTNDVVTAYATSANSYFDPSDVATSGYSIATGVANGVVTLNDMEDHTWTYYAGIPADVDPGTYNTTYLGTLYCPDPRNVKITYRGNGGAVSISEPETTFVYYKTLEKDLANNSYPYQVISNPFSKRPTGKGFGGWKIISGGEYISGYNNNQTLPLDQEITFANLPYPSTNCISAEIVFEATWVDLNNIVRRTSKGDYTYSATGGTYETNILVIQRNQTGTITTSSPVTIMMVEPDGSADYRNSYTFTGNITPNNSGVTKIEFAKWNSSNTLNCNGHSVTVGRGMTTTSQCANYVTGVTGKTSNSGLATYSNSLTYQLKLESGKFNYVSFIAGTNSNDGYVKLNGAANKIKGTLGNDYDRAKNDNTKFNITQEVFMGYRPTLAAGNTSVETFKCYVKSGDICSAQSNNNANAAECFYISCGGTQTNSGRRVLIIEGGQLLSVAGGIDENNNETDETVFIRMKGGRLRGSMYGAAAFAATKGHRRFVITGGTINGWVAGGCNGVETTNTLDGNSGVLPADTYLYIGGKARVVTSSETQTDINSSPGGHVFGAGVGRAALVGKAQGGNTGKINSSNVVIADESEIEHNVFGGGNFGYSDVGSNIYITGGLVHGAVFGGANQNKGGWTKIVMNDGTVEGGIYGGSNLKGVMAEYANIHVDGGQVGTESAHANIHGGGYGSETVVTKNVDITLGRSVGQADPVVVYGDVYGGSALGKVNGTAATNTYHTHVTMNAGIVHGDIYGGGLGDASNAANVYGPVTVNIHGGEAERVFGCNNTNGRPMQNTNHVNMDGGQVGYIYGGGNAAPYTGTPYVDMTGGTVINHVFGGGLGTNAKITGSTNVTIRDNANVLKNVYGGGNAAEVTGDTYVKVK